MRRVLVFSLLSVMSVAASWVTGTPTTQAADCAKVLFVGARGSGETARDAGGFGSTVDQIRAGLAGGLADAGLPLKSVAVSYPSESVDKLLKPSKGWWKSANEFFTGLEIGVDVSESILNARASCPHERIVLGGYSQGAMVMHRVLSRLNSATLAKISAVVVVADGDKIPSTHAESVGTAPTSGQGIGEWARTHLTEVPGWTNDGSDFPLAMAGRTRHICNAGDMVCDFSFGQTSSSRTRKNAIDTHTSYKHMVYGEQAGRWAAGKAAADMTRTPTITLAEPLSGPAGSTVFIEVSGCPAGAPNERAGARYSHNGLRASAGNGSPQRLGITSSQWQAAGTVDDTFVVECMLGTDPHDLWSGRTTFTFPKLSYSATSGPLTVGISPVKPLPGELLTMSGNCGPTRTSWSYLHYALFVKAGDAPLRLVHEQSSTSAIGSSNQWQRSVQVPNDVPSGATLSASALCVSQSRNNWAAGTATVA